MKVMGPAQTFTGPFPVVIRFLAPVIGGGAAATAAVLGDGRGLAHHHGEKKESGVPSGQPEWIPYQRSGNWPERIA